MYRGQNIPLWHSLIAIMRSITDELQVNLLLWFFFLSLSAHTFIDSLA